MTDNDIALNIARQLIQRGIPVFVAKPALDESGNWNPKGGNDGCGYWLPPKWQKTPADLSTLNGFRPGVDALGMVCGQGLDGIDVDPRNGGVEQRSGLDEAGFMPVVYGVAATPSGGTHELVRSLGVSKYTDLFPGVDVQAGTGDGQGRGFLFIAPTRKLSKVDGTVHTYSWLQEPDWEMYDAEAADDTSGEALAEAIRSRRSSSGGEDRESTPTPEYDSLTADKKGQVNRYVDGAIKGITSDLLEMKDWAPGQRDDHGDGWEKRTADAAFALARLALAPWNRFTLAEGRKILEDNAPTDRDWSTRDVQGKWESQVGQAMNKPHPGIKFRMSMEQMVDTSPEEAATAPVIATDGTPEEKNETPTTPELRVLNLAQIKALPPAEPMVDKLLYRGTLVQISGNPGSFKSFVALSLSLAVASDLDSWESYPVRVHGPVIYVAAEGANGMAARAEAWCQDQKIDSSTLKIVFVPEPVQLGNWQQYTPLLELAKKIRAALVVFDTRARCTTGMEENSATEQGPAIEVCERIRTETGCTVLVVHHSSRGGTAGRGSNAWDGAVWSDLRLTREAGSMTVTLHCEKHKDVADGCDHQFRMLPITVSEDRMPGATEESRNTLKTVQNDDRTTPDEWTEKKRQILDIVRTNAGRTGLTRAEIRDMAAEKGIGRTMAYDYMNQLISGGFLNDIGSAKREKLVATEKEWDAPQ